MKKWTFRIQKKIEFNEMFGIKNFYCQDRGNSTLIKDVWDTRNSDMNERMNSCWNLAWNLNLIYQMVEQVYPNWVLCL